MVTPLTPACPRSCGRCSRPGGAPARSARSTCSPTSPGYPRLPALRVRCDTHHRGRARRRVAGLGGATSTPNITSPFWRRSGRRTCRTSPRTGRKGRTCGSASRRSARRTLGRRRPSPRTRRRRSPCLSRRGLADRVDHADTRQTSCAKHPHHSHSWHTSAMCSRTARFARRGRTSGGLTLTRSRAQSPRSGARPARARYFRDRRPSPPEGGRYKRQVYFADLAHLDLQLGRVFEALEGPAPSRHLIVLLSDHGETAGRPRLLWQRRTALRRLCPCAADHRRAGRSGRGYAMRWCS